MTSTTEVPTLPHLPCVICRQPATIQCTTCTYPCFTCSGEHHRQHDVACRSGSLPNGISVQSSVSAGGISCYAAETYTVNALIMRVDADHPLFEAVTCMAIRSPADSWATTPLPHVAQFFQDARAALVHHRGPQMERLDNPYQIFYCPMSLCGLRRVCNRAVARLVEGSNPMPLPWLGPVVVLKYASMMCDAYVDVTPDDLGNIQAYFAGYGLWRREGQRR
ncbi:hypothetical protein OH77DRAFT_1230778 [Trametes cingulata]|nr:hypothetical protein OH77DRAFT_1230778 [Trametes cingulata]